MALSTFVGSFTVPVATGNKSVTGVGFQGKAIIFWGNGRSSDGASQSTTLNADVPYYVGFATSSSARAVIGVDDDASSAAAVSFSSGTKCLQFNEIGVTKFAADFVSFDADGFTVNFTTGFLTADIVNFMVFGGTDLTNANIISFTSQTATGNAAVTGAGFQPNAIFVLGESHGGVDGTHICPSIGFGISATARGASDHEYDGGQTGVYQRTAKIFVNTANHALVREADLVTLDSDGFTLNWTTANATTVTGYALCLKGGRYQVGSLSQKTSTGSQATTGVGFAPTGLWLQHVGNAASATPLNTTMNIGLGAASGAANRAVLYYLSGSHGVAELDRAAIYTKRADDGTPTLTAKADLTSFDSDGFTLNFTTADGTAREILYFAVGSNATAPVTNKVYVKNPSRPAAFKPMGDAFRPGKFGGWR